MVLDFPFTRVVCVASVLLALSCALAAVAQDEDHEALSPFTRLYDTAVTNGPMTASRSEWQVIDEDVTAHDFQGDAVFENNFLAVRLRKHSLGAELYSRTPSGVVAQAVLKPVMGESERGFAAIRIQHNAADSVVLDALFPDVGGVASGIRLELQVGQCFLKATALGEVAALRVESPSAFVVLPDFFADDIVVAATDLPAGRAELPSENFLLNLRGKGDALVMNVWEHRAQDVRVITGKAGGAPAILGTEVSFGDAGAVWVAALAEPGLWHSQTIQLSDKDRIIPLKWKQPYPAVWRLDWRRSDSLTDSWEMALENPDGSYRKSDLFENSRDAWTDNDWWFGVPRNRWTTGLGKFMYPCWIDKHGYGHVQPLKKVLEFEGPAVLYPINRNADTPLDKFSVTDIVRLTLGVGPCQYILDVEGQDSSFKGRPTCDVRDQLNPMYEQRTHLGQADEINKALDEMLAFIRLIRGRIEQYRQFAEEMEFYLTTEQAKAQAPEAFLKEMHWLNGRVLETIAHREEGIKTPDYATTIVDEFRKNLIGYTGEDAGEACEIQTKKFTVLGNQQDELVAECRLAVKLLRQHAALSMAKHPETTEIVREIRKRTQAVLRDPVNYEAARH